MNRIPFQIKRIEKSGKFNLVLLESKGIQWESLTLELKPGLKDLSYVMALFKEMAVALYTQKSVSASPENLLDARIISIHKGVLLSEIFLESVLSGLTAVITNGALDRLGLEPGQNVTAVVMAADVSIMEV